MNLTIARITARGLFGRARVLLLVPLPALLIVLALVAHRLQPDARHWGAPLLDGLGFTVVLPVIALIVGTGVLGSEIDDGTVVHILTKPVPRGQIVLAKLAVAVGITAVTSASAMFVAGTVIESVRLGLALAAACVAGALAYCAVFLLLSLVSRRPVLIGLLYILIWEGVLGDLLSGTRALSVHQYVLTIADRLSGSPIVDGHVSLPVSLAMSAVFLLAGTILAVDRLRSFSLTGETN